MTANAPSRPAPDTEQEEQSSRSTRRPGGGLRLPGTVGLVALCVLFTLALRAPFFGRPLLPDEAGLLIIAHNWSEGPYIYGDYFVGRGALLMLFYAVADALGGAVPLRLMAAVVAVGLVVAAGWAGHQLRGRAGAGWGALVAAAYSSTYAFGSEGMNGRLLAAALVMGTCAVTLAAVRRRSFGLAVLAGFIGTTPLLVVQSYADGLLFAGVLLLASWQAKGLSIAQVGKLAAAGLTGVLVAVGVVAVGIWLTWPTADQLWYQLIGFRLETQQVITEGTDAPARRMVELLVTLALAGVPLLLAGFLGGFRQLRRDPRLRPVWFAAVAMIALVVVGMFIGGDFWPDYPQQLIPGLVLATALVAPSTTWSAYLTRGGVVAAAAASVAAVYVAHESPVLGTPTNEAAVGQWVAEGAEEDDTAVVLFGKANVLYHADMTAAPPYPHLWSLLTRTLDPDLDLLVETLEGREAPTWVVQWHDLETWDLDSEGRLAEVLAKRYTHVGTPCNRDVYLLRGEERDVPPEDACDPRG